MSSPSQLFRATDIRDAIGMLADGCAVDPQLLPVVRAAVAGPCPTSDQGDREFFVDVSGCSLFNVDTEELIWPHEPGFEDPDYLPLRTLTNAVLWERTGLRWEHDRPRDWTAFVWRVAVPLSNRLGFVGAWRTTG